MMGSDNDPHVQAFPVETELQPNLGSLQGEQHQTHRRVYRTTPYFEISSVSKNDATRRIGNPTTL
jgi:hypothetical protein